MTSGKLRFLGLSVLRAMTNRPSRVVLLTAALAITASLATALIAVSQGVEARLSGSLRAFGANLVVEPSASRVGAGGLALGEVEAALDPTVYTAAIAAIKGVESVKPQVRITVSAGDRDVLLLGVRSSDMATTQWRLSGSLPQRGQVLVGAGLASRLGLHVGSRISQLDGAVVSGIVESGAEQDEAVIMPLQDALRLTSGKVSEFLVRADGRTLDAVAAAIRRSDPALATRTVRQVAEAERSLLDRVRRLLLIVTLCVALVSAIAVGNTQSIVVLERTQEIGLLKAIGSTRRFIVTYFALEGGVIALTGGVLGLVAGIAVAEGIAAGVFGAAIPIEPAVWPVPFVVALVVSSVSGVLPVWRAAAVDAAMTLKGL